MLSLIERVPEWFASLFKRCDEVARVDRGGRPFYIIGHRGSPCQEVENTIASFETAMEKDGANALETDLCITRDGAVILWHDWNPDDSVCKLRQSGMEPDVKFCPCPPEDGEFRKPINQIDFNDFVEHYGYTAKDGNGDRVEAYIPSFAEFIRWAMTKPRLELVFLDIKIPEGEEYEVPRMMECIQRVLEHYRPGFRIVFETQYASVLEAMKNSHPHYDYALDTAADAGVVLRPEMFSAVRSAIEHGNTFATPQRPRGVTMAPWSTFKRIVGYDAWLRLWHNANGDGRPVEGIIPFTVNTEREISCLISIGVDGIQSDRPDMVARVAARMGTVIRKARKPVVSRPAATPVGIGRQVGMARQ